MAKTPNKIYFDVSAKQLYDEQGRPTSKRNTLPSITLTEKQLVNIQLVTDANLTAYTELPAGATADFIVDNDFSNPQPLRTLSNGSGQWTLSTGGGTDEYYYNVALSDTADKVYENAVLMTSGTAGSLAAGEWALGDVDSIGETRLYVRLTATGDPDAQAAGYLTYKYADGTYSKNFIYSSDFNASGTWWDSDTSSFRDPVIEDGELTFSITANTDQYLDRIIADTDAIRTGIANTSTQINIFEPGTGDLFRQFRFLFLCRNRFLNDGQVTLDLQQVVVYTKSEVDAIVAGYIPVVSPATAGNAVQLKADGTLEDAGFPPGSGGGGSGDLVGPSSATDNAVTRFDSTTGKLVQDSGVIIDDLDNVTGINDLTASTATVDDQEYDATWDGDTTVPTKNAVYDEMELKLDKDFLGLTNKSTLAGTERIALDDDGTPSRTTIDNIVTAAADAVSIDPIDYGWYRDSSEYGYAYNGIPGGLVLTRDTADAEVVLLMHMDGEWTGTTFTDDSQFGHTVTNVGTPYIANDSILSLGNRTAYLDGASGFTVPVTNFDPGANSFGFACRAYIENANKLTEMTLLHIGTDDDTSKVIHVYMDNGYLYAKLGTDQGSGEWTEIDSVEVVTAGYANIDAWNFFLAQRVGNSFYVGINDTILMKFDMTGKTLNTPDVTSLIRVFHGYESATEDTFWITQGDEVILTDGIAPHSTITGDPFSTFTEPTDEYYTTTKYDLLSGTGEGAYTDSFVDADLTAGILTVTHSLNNQYCVVAVYDNNDDLVIPDDITATDANNLDIDLSSYGTLTGTWNLIVVATSSTVGGAGEVNTASSLGAGADVFKQKNGTDFEFRSLESTNGSIDIEEDTSTVNLTASNIMQTVTVTSTPRTLGLSDAKYLVRMNLAGANTLTIPTNAAVAFEIGQMIIVRQAGAGTTTITASSGVTLNGVTSPSSGGDISGQYQDVMLHKIGTDEWEAIGAIGTVS